MGKNQSSTRRDLLSLAKFVADVRAAGPQAWKSVERLKQACALEAAPTLVLARDLGDPSFSRGVQDVRSEFGKGFDHWELATWLSSPNGRLQSRFPVDLLVSDTSSVLAAPWTDRSVVQK